MTGEVIDWGDGETDPVTLTDGKWSGSHTYAAAGDYHIALKDGDEEVAETEFEAVEEPSAAPTLKSLTPATAKTSDAKMDVVVKGTGFTNETVIVWGNGREQDTTFVSATEVSSNVDPSLVNESLPFTDKVTVKNGSGPEVTPKLDFVWTGA